DGRPAGRTEMKGQGVAAFSHPRPRRGLARDGNLLTLKARLVAHHGSGAALAGQAVTHRDARWLALDRQVQLPTAARGASAGHELSPIETSSARSTRAFATQIYHTAGHASSNGVATLYTIGCSDVSLGGGNEATRVHYAHRRCSDVAVNGCRTTARASG